MEDKTIQSLEIKRARLRGIRPLTKEEIKVKAEIDIFKYVIKKIQDFRPIDVPMSEVDRIKFTQQIIKLFNGKE